MLRANSSTPLYKQLYDKILAQIDSGSLREGDKLPSVRELAADFGINRLTAKKAIDLLAQDGYVKIYQRIGAFVEPYRNTTGKQVPHLDMPASLPQSAASTCTLSVSIILADEGLAEQLRITCQEKVIKVEQLRLLDGLPIALETSWVPCALCVGVPDTEMECKPLMAIRQHIQNVDRSRTDEAVQAILATERELMLLDLSGPMALLSIQRTTYDVAERVIEYAQIVYPQDRFHIATLPQQWH